MSTSEVQAHDRLRRHWLRRLAGAEDRHWRAGEGGAGAGEAVPQPTTRAQLQPHGHRRACAGNGGAFRGPSERVQDVGAQVDAGAQRLAPGGHPGARRRRAAASFHARFDAKGKQYRYFVWNHPAMNPLLRQTAWHVPRPLDLAAMRAAAKSFVGQHDFPSFTSNPGYARETTVRTLAPLRDQETGTAAYVHHRRRRFSLQNVPRNCRHAGRGGIGQTSVPGDSH